MPEKSRIRAAYPDDRPDTACSRAHRIEKSIDIEPARSAPLNLMTSRSARAPLEHQSATDSKPPEDDAVSDPRALQRQVPAYSRREQKFVAAK